MGFKEVQVALRNRQLARATEEDRRAYAKALAFADTVNSALMSDDSLDSLGRYGKVTISLTDIKKSVSADDWGGVLRYLQTHFEDWPGFGFTHDFDGNPQLEFSQYPDLI